MAEIHGIGKITLTVSAGELNVITKSLAGFKLRGEERRQAREIAAQLMNGRTAMLEQAAAAARKSLEAGLPPDDGGGEEVLPPSREIG